MTPEPEEYLFCDARYGVIVVADLVIQSFVQKVYLDGKGFSDLCLYSFDKTVDMEETWDDILRNRVFCPVFW